VRRDRQSGLAAVTAILIVAVAASAAAVMLAQESATLDQAMMVASRAQAEQYSRAGLDWARGVLAQDGQASGDVDSLAEGWAQPIVGLPVERAVVAGNIVDEQGKFNLNNLVSGKSRSDEDVEIFRRLLASLGLPPQLSDAVVDWIDPDQDLTSSDGAEDAYYLGLARPYRAANQPMTQVEELFRVKGFDAAAVAKLSPYVTALIAPARTPINVNTAPAQVLTAALPGVPPAAIAQMVAGRTAKPFPSKVEVDAWAKAIDPKVSTAALDVKSGFFSVHVRVAQDDVQLADDALLQRTLATGKPAVVTVVWRRPRF
jgi:general secretion pathway protein K